MISYRLACELGHEFSAKFKNQDAYNKQQKQGFLQCPLCNNTNISKLLSSPNVISKTNDNKNTASFTKQGNAYEEWKKFCDYVKSDFDDVGEKFPEEARKIHYGESEFQKIYGQANPDEIRELNEEGIKTLPLPIINEKKKN